MGPPRCLLWLTLPPPLLSPAPLASQGSRRASKAHSEQPCGRGLLDISEGTGWTGAGSQQAGLAGGSLRSAQVILGVPCVPGAHLTPTLRPHPDPSSSCRPAETDTGSSFRRGLSSRCREVTGRIAPPRGQPSGLYWPSEDAPPSGTGRPRGSRRKGGDPTSPDSSQPLGWAVLGTQRGCPAATPS